jgi:hypothetical protein
MAVMFLQNVSKYKHSTVLKPKIRLSIWSTISTTTPKLCDFITERLLMFFITSFLSCNMSFIHCLIWNKILNTSTFHTQNPNIWPHHHLHSYTRESGKTAGNQNSFIWPHTTFGTFIQTFHSFINLHRILQIKLKNNYAS